MPAYTIYTAHPCFLLSLPHLVKEKSRYRLFLLSLEMLAGPNSPRFSFDHTGVWLLGRFTTSSISEKLYPPKIVKFYFTRIVKFLFDFDHPV